MESENNTTFSLQGSPELRSRMPRGSIAMLSRKYGKSWMWIYRVISGNVNGNIDILADAIRLAEIEDESRIKINNII